MVPVPLLNLLRNVTRLANLLMAMFAISSWTTKKELVDHLNHPEDKRLVQVVALLELCTHGRGNDVQGKSVGEDEHGVHFGFEEGQIAYELCLRAQMLASATASGALH